MSEIEAWRRSKKEIEYCDTCGKILNEDGTCPNPELDEQIKRQENKGGKRKGAGRPPKGRLPGGGQL